MYPFGTEERRSAIREKLDSLGYKPPFTQAQYGEAGTLLREDMEKGESLRVQDLLIARIQKILEVVLTDRQEERLRKAISRHGFIGDI